VRGHFELARSLSELRDEGVLLLGSGNIVHNLRDAFGRMRAGTIETPEWAQRYDETVKKILTQRDTEALLSMWPDSNDARLAHPTPDHWLPLIYAYGATNSDEHARFPNEGFDWGSISMRNAVFG
jgi:4,5-DOPA dioxygenase extradiol